MPTCVIMSDSTFDFSSFQAKVEGVRVVPFHYTDARGSFSGDDDLFASVTPHEFYNAIASGAELMTSQPSQLEFEELFNGVGEDEEAVLFCISTGISGGYNGAMAAFNRLCEDKPELREKIFIIDTLIASTPMHLLVHEACRKRDAGAAAREIYEWAMEARWNTQTIFMVDGLETLHRGGRIPRSVATVGEKLNVKPLISFDHEGRLSIVGVARGRKKGIQKLAEYYTAHHDNYLCPPVVSVGSADCDPKDIERLKQQIVKANGPVRFLETNIGPVCGCHVGAGMMSCCFWGRGPRKA
jgi:DegV family protein with EDD domain